MTSAINVPFSVRTKHTMRIVNLNNRYRLGKEGFAIGLHFKSYNQAYIACCKYLRSKYGQEWDRWQLNSDRDSFRWATYRNRLKSDYWIGIRDEATLTILLLSVPELAQRKIRDERKRTA